eukprot:gene6488-7231_t
MRSRLLLEKHPVGAEATEDTLLLGPEPVVEPIIFDVTNEEMLLKAAQMTRGGSGPSGIDADDWCKILSSRDFGDAGNDLRSAIAAVTRSLCTRNVGDQSITALMASRLVPLDKIPGLRPIGVGEVLRRIMGELTDVWTEIRKSTIRCVRGSRSRFQQHSNIEDLDVIPKRSTISNE